MKLTNMDLDLEKYDFSFWDDIPDDINCAEDFVRNIEASNKSLKILLKAQKESENKANKCKENLT